MRTKVSLIIITMILSVYHVSAEKVFRYSTDGIPDTLSPLKANKHYSNEIVTAIYDTLYEYKYLKSPLEIKPCLAKELPQISIDGLVYTIEIKSGVRFTDDPAFRNGKGREINAFDVVYSLKRHFHINEISYGRWLWEDRIVGMKEWKDLHCDYDKEVEGLKAIGKYKIQMILNKPYPQLTYTLAMGYSAIVAHEVVDFYSDEIDYHPVGSGPFILKSLNRRKCILVKNPDYRKETMDSDGYADEIHGKYGIKTLLNQQLPIVDRIEIEYFNSPIKRWQAFENGGKVHFSDLPNEMINKVIKKRSTIQLKDIYSQSFHFLPYQALGLIYCDFNMADPRIGYHNDTIQNSRNKALRNAIKKGFNWVQRINRFHLGIGEPIAGVIPPGLEDKTFESSLHKKEFNPEDAKKILSQSGWTEETLPIFEFHSMLSPLNIQGFEQFCQWMKDIGYPRNKIQFVSYRSHEDFVSAIKEKKCMFYIQNWQMDYPDPQNIFQAYYSGFESYDLNGSNFKNKEFDRLYEAASIMWPGPERSKIYQQMNQLLIRESPCISGFSPTRIYMWNKNVVMFYRPSPMGSVFKYIDVR